MSAAVRAAAASRVRADRGTPAATWALALKDLRVALTYRASFASGLVATFYGLLVFHFVSRLIGVNAQIASGESYFDFVVIGVAISGVLRAATGAAAANARRDQVEGTLEMLAAQPISPLALGLGWTAWPVVQSLIGVAGTFAIASLLGFSGADANWASAGALLALSIVAFVPIGFLGAAAILVAQQGGQITGLAVAGMMLVSGVLFPVAVLPAGLRALASVSPLTYALRGLRKAILDGAPLHAVAGELGVLALCGAVLFPLGTLALRLALGVARRRGTLARF